MPSVSVVRFSSSILNKTVTYSALIPDRSGAGFGPYPLLFMFHPRGGDHSDWLYLAQLAQRAERFPGLIVLPSLEESLGCDMASGEAFERFFIDELWPHIDGAYLVKQGPEHTALCGVGSGGYAALRFALAYPYWFGAAVSLSGEIDATQEERVKEAWGAETAQRRRRVFGEPNDPRRKTDNLYRLAENLDPELAPSLYLACGQSDPLLAQNREFHRRLSGLRIRHDFNEQAGEHDWNYWNSLLPMALSFIENRFEA